MTIAAAFRCTDGVIICADTQEVVPNFTKVNSAGKIACLQRRGGESFVFTGAGDADLIDVAVEKIMDAISNNPDIGVQNYAKFRALLETQAQQIFRDHVAPYAAFPRDERPGANLLLSAQCLNTVQIFRIVETRVKRIDTTATSVGIGNQLATGLLDRYFHQNAKFSMETTSRLAAFILEQVKEYVPDVGGYTDMVRQPHDGDVQYSTVTGWEAGCIGLDAATNMMLQAVCGSTSENELGKELSDLSDYLRHVWKVFH